MGYSPWGGKELDTTERLSTHARAWKARRLTACSTVVLGFRFPKYDNHNPPTHSLETEVMWDDHQS